MKKYVIVVASGVGKRMQDSNATDKHIPKQFLVLKDKPVVLHTLENIHQASDDYRIILVLNREHIGFWQKIVEDYGVSIPHRVVFGGSERFFSVKNAIESIDEQEECLIAIHDGVRPLADKEVFDRCFQDAKEKGNAVCSTKCVDSVRIVKDNEENTAFNRDNLRLIQTPQCFHLSTLRKAYRQEYSKEFTDDASVVEAIGEKIHLCLGDRRNIKITTPVDLKIAESLL